MLSLGFEICKYGHNVYLQHVGELLQVIVLYVDDLFITGSCTKEIGSIKSSLHNEFSMVDLGLLRQFLRIEIDQYEAWMNAIQPKFTAYLLFKFKISECKESKLPFLLGIKLADFGASPLVDILLYR